jgi:hypothetical protein
MCQGNPSPSTFLHPDSCILDSVMRFLRNQVARGLAVLLLVAFVPQLRVIQS